MTIIPTVDEVESSRLRWTEFEHDENPDDGSEVVAGLTGMPKTLPYKYFYDDRGSELFVEITRQPEYYPTRTERWILDTHAPDIAATAAAGELLELGSGAADKTRALIGAMLERGGMLRFLPIDVSGGILRDSSRELLQTYPDLEIWGLIGTYHQALQGLPEAERGRRLLIFLGSSIGNMTDAEADAFLGEAHAALDPGDHFLVGFDLQKPVELLEAAYNDRAGVTAAFNLNMLCHLNRRFDGDFDTGRFAHRAFYDRRAHHIEMHLERTSASASPRSTSRSTSSRAKPSGPRSRASSTCPPSPAASTPAASLPRPTGPTPRTGSPSPCSAAGDRPAAATRNEKGARPAARDRAPRTRRSGRPTRGCRTAGAGTGTC